MAGPPRAGARSCRRARRGRQSVAGGLEGASSRRGPGRGPLLDRRQPDRAGAVRRGREVAGRRRWPRRPSGGRPTRPCWRWPMPTARRGHTDKAKETVGKLIADFPESKVWIGRRIGWPSTLSPAATGRRRRPSYQQVLDKWPQSALGAYALYGLGWAKLNARAITPGRRRPSTPWWRVTAVTR